MKQTAVRTKFFFGERWAFTGENHLYIRLHIFFSTNLIAYFNDNNTHSHHLAKILDNGSQS